MRTGTKDTMNAHSGPHGKSAFLSSARMISLRETIFGVAMTLQASALLPCILKAQGTVLDTLQGMHEQLGVAERRRPQPQARWTRYSWGNK